MTRTTNARLAGVTYFVYLAAGIASLSLSRWPQGSQFFAIFTSFSALVLGVTLWALTRDQDPHLAMLALACRIVEGVPGPGEIYFAVATTIFFWLLLRGRMIPTGLASAGVVVSGLLAFVILLQTAGLFGGPSNWGSPITWIVHLPMLVLELTFAVWLLTRGVAQPSPRPST